MHLNLLTLAGDDFKHYPETNNESLSGLGFWGTILPDFGFPDKQMAKRLISVWPGEDWDRGQVYDLYKWYETGLKSGQKPYNADSNYNPIYGWVKNSSPYTDTKITHWFTIFREGIKANWISGSQVGTGLAPEHEGTKIADTIGALPGAGTGLIKELKWVALGGTALIIAFYAMPLISKGVKIKRKAGARLRTYRR